MRTSVIIPTYNRKNILTHCLYRILNQTVKDYEVIVVDDGSTDGTEKLSEINKIKYIKLNERKGPIAARNIGIKNAEGEIIIFLDSDVLVSENFVEDHVKLHSLKDPVGKNNLIVQGVVRHIKKPEDFGKFSLLIDGVCFTGLITQNVSIRKEWIVKVGSFDESLTTEGYEDVDIGRKLKQFGLHTIYVVRKCRAWHVDGKPSIKALKQRFNQVYLQAKNSLLLANKYGKFAHFRYVKSNWILFISNFFETHKWAEKGSTLNSLVKLHDSPILVLYPLIKQIIKYHYRAKGIRDIRHQMSDVKSENVKVRNQDTQRLLRRFAPRNDGRDKTFNFLFLSNCYGEDRSAALIAQELKKLKPNIEVFGAPLISQGEEYEKRGIPLLIKSKIPPSGGFPTRSPVALLKDIITSFYIPIRYYIVIRKIRKTVDYGVVVGDVFLLVIGWLGLLKQLYFLAPAKSDYQKPHYKFEEWLIRKLAVRVFTHDEFTAQNLRKKSISASFLGNPMIDELHPEGNFSAGSSRDGIPEKKLIGILPGSRVEAYKNFLKILEVVELISNLRNDLAFAAAIPGVLSFKKLIKLSKKSGWQSTLEIHQSEFYKVEIEKKDTKVLLLSNAFVDIIKHSVLIIGLAGTANEQAAALRKPIVSFTGTGPQTSKIRMKNQERLLGGCLKFVNNFPKGVVNEILQLLDNEKLRKTMGEAGVKKMGTPGGAKKIAKLLDTLIEG
ncbi:MAG: lipid-A-disaccharide synthase-related protein [bacterium]|nr:lipid-A-disaccharide synthase-related protein [bacterium]